ncbi:glycosyltransferase family 29 protein [Cohaesibacter celericrescens]|nr:glycosyltransferase family 29 protein [Cohaesibacter celericrescens]
MNHQNSSPPDIGNRNRPHTELIDRIPIPPRRRPRPSKIQALWARLSLAISPLPNAADALQTLKGKKVALVGNAQSLTLQKYGSQIDSHDIVIRCNRAVLKAADSHGTKTDWFALSQHVDLEMIQQRNASRALWFSQNRKYLPFWMVQRQFSSHLLTAEEYRSICVGSGLARPSTGFMMFHLAIESDCEMLTLYGFDFFKSNSTSGDHTATTTPHNFSAEEAVITERAKRDTRVTICI